ncbi:hypothetical protein [Ruegeria atlantica]|uniref:Sel1 repeat n=1 Tax=Ruegeria atlantica TaxID=81569 RepID=A0A0P1EA46_9RHOB|nr:hypothetical protein [Ruegeria atlantica]CUH45880.1 hypothetical protein RUA4292_00043 [Ruegeria atlantica]
MRRLSILAGLIIAFSTSAAAADACKKITVGASLKKHQLHCDLTRGLTAADVSFLSSKLDTEYRIGMNEVSEEATDAAFYLGTALILGQGTDTDEIAGAKLLAEVAAKKQSFDAYDRPGMAFFSALGFSNSIRTDLFRAVLLGNGPGADAQSAALLDKHIDQVGRAGNADALVNIVALINRRLPSATPPAQRPGYAFVKELAGRHAGAAQLLSDWTGETSDLVQDRVADGGSSDANTSSEASGETVHELADRAEKARRNGELAKALELYERAADLGYPSALYISSLKRRIVQEENEASAAKASAELAAKVIPRVVGNPDAIKGETWKLTTDSFTRPLCGKLRRSGGMPALLVGKAATLQVKNDGCEFFSILAGSFRIAVGQVNPGDCDAAGCDVALRIGCRSRGAPLLAFCSDFYSSHPQYLNARLEPDANSQTGFRLRIP